MRRSAPPLRTEGAFALVLSADPAEADFGKLIPDGRTAENSRRILGCGIPETLPEALAGTEPEGVVTLERLAAPEFSIAR